MSRIAHPLTPAIAVVVASLAVAATATPIEERLNRGDHLHGLYPSKEHVVARHDTLWDLSRSYLKDPFIWPEIWQVNPQIDDPDRIYPGNQVQLPGYAPATPAAPHLPRLTTMATPEAAAAAAASGVPPTAPPPVAATTDQVSRSGWLASLREEVGVGRILGSWYGQRKMLATDGSVYLSLGSRDGVVAGDHFQVVEADEIIRHPVTDEPVGRLVRVVGEVEATEIHDATSSGRIVRTLSPLTAGDRVMPVPTPPPVAAKGRTDGPEGLRATVVATPDKRVSIATDDVIFLDVGTDQQVRPGDHFFLVHDNDLAVEGGSVRFTNEAVVIDARARTCTAMITKSLTEAYVGNQATYASTPLPDIYHQ